MLTKQAANYRDAAAVSDAVRALIPAVVDKTLTVKQLTTTGTVTTRHAGRAAA